MGVFSGIYKLKDDNAKKRTLHLNRDCEVFVLKTVKASNLSLFLEEYNEFIKNKMLIKVKDMSNNYVSTYAFQTTGQGKGNPKDFKNLESLTDIFSITAYSSVETIGSANITLINFNKRYEFIDYDLKKGSCVFSPMDTVIVKLPGLDNRLYNAFYGTISTVTLSVIDGAKTRTVNLSCEDEMKKLRISRTNIRPSLNVKEAKTAIIAYENPFINMKTYEALTEILGRTYIDFDIDAIIQAQLTSIDSQVEAVESGSSGTELKNPYASKAFQKDNIIKSNIREKNFIFTYPSDASLTIEVIGVQGESTSNITQNESRTPVEIWGFSSRDLPETKDEILRATELMGGNAKFKVSNLKFIISGTNQPAFVIGYNKGDFPLWESDFQTNYDILQKICKNIFFECFADVSGIIHVRPLNVSLPGDSDHITGRVGSEYQIDDLHIISDEIIDTDNGSVSLIYPRGSFKFDIPNNTGWLVNPIYDNKVYQKYGWRIAPQFSIIGVTDRIALARYGYAMLNRMNKYINSGSITMKGDARITVGNPIYHKSRNKVYYIRGITHNYMPGTSYNMTLDLVYGRSPICYTDKGAARRSLELQREGRLKDAQKVFTKGFSKYIKDPRNNLDIESIYSRSASVLESQKDRIIRNLENLSFGDYVWEDISELNYDELTNESTRQIRRAPYYKQTEIDQYLKSNRFIDNFKEQVKKTPAASFISNLYGFTVQQIKNIKDLIK